MVTATQMLQPSASLTAGFHLGPSKLPILWKHPCLPILELVRNDLPGRGLRDAVKSCLRHDKVATPWQLLGMRRSKRWRVS